MGCMPRVGSKEEREGWGDKEGGNFDLHASIGLISSRNIGLFSLQVLRVASMMAQILVPLSVP